MILKFLLFSKVARTAKESHVSCASLVFVFSIFLHFIYSFNVSMIQHFHNVLAAIYFFPTMNMKCGREPLSDESHRNAKQGPQITKSSTVCLSHLKWEKRFVWRKRGVSVHQTKSHSLKRQEREILIEVPHVMAREPFLRYFIVL